MINVNKNQILRVFLKKIEPDGVISLDRYGSFDNEQGLRLWLGRFSLRLDDFRYSENDNVLRLTKNEDMIAMRYELYIKLYHEIDVRSCFDNTVQRED